MSDSIPGDRDTTVDKTEKDLTFLEQMIEGDGK